MECTCVLLIFLVELWHDNKVVKEREMKKVILKSEDGNEESIITCKQNLIDLAQKEHKDDVEINDGYDDLPADYPRSIETYSEALTYLQTYYSARYANLGELEFEDEKLTKIVA